MFVSGDSKYKLKTTTQDLESQSRSEDSGIYNLVVFEGDHNVVLEIGYTRTTLRDKPYQKRTFHYIIKENLRYMCEF